MAKFWPLHHCDINVWERMGEKHLAQLVGEGACQPDIFTKYRLGCELSYGTCPISLCALQPLLFKVVLWPNFGHCTTVTTINVWERMEKNTWHSSWERERVNLIFSPNAGWNVS